MQLKAIETSYAGCRFRSRLEARWAVFFDALGVRWEYEPEGFEMPSGRYLPDFWLPEKGLWIEVKPGEHAAPRQPSVYLVGKMDSNWRIDPSIACGISVANPELQELNHGQAEGGEIVDASLEGIADCEAVFAWIESSTAYGSLVELGYAKGKQKKTFVGLRTDASLGTDHDHGHECWDHWTGGSGPTYLKAKAKFGELWFAVKSATKGGVFDSLADAAAAFKLGFFPSVFGNRDDEEKAKEFSAHNDGQPIALFRNPPVRWASPTWYLNGNIQGHGIDFYVSKNGHIPDSALAAARSARFGVGGRG